MVETFPAGILKESFSAGDNASEVCFGRWDRYVLEGVVKLCFSNHTCCLNISQ